MPQQTFETTVESGERGRVFIVFPFDPAEVWGKKARHYVKGTLNGTPFQGSLGVRNGQHFMPLNKELQKSASLSPGDKVKVVVDADEAERAALPADFEHALKGEQDARKFFETLTPFQSNTYLEWITSAKKAETRAARIQEAVEMLKAGKRQR